MDDTLAQLLNHIIKLELEKVQLLQQLDQLQQKENGEPLAQQPQGE